MKKFTKRVLSAVTAAFIAVSGMSTFAVSAEENLTTENNSEAEVSNYTETVVEYNKQHVGDVVTFSNGMKFVIWSREIMQSEDAPNNFYVHTEFVEYNPSTTIDFQAESILDAVPYSGNITPYYSAMNTHAFSNTSNIFTATNITRFEYDGTSYPTVYSEEYDFSNTEYMDFVSWKATNNFLTGSTTNKLSYTYNTYSVLEGGYTTYKDSVSVTCKKNGTKAD